MTAHLAGVPLEELLLPLSGGAGLLFGLRTAAARLRRRRRGRVDVSRTGAPVGR